MNIQIKNGHLIDPKNQIDGLCDLFIVAGKVAAIGSAPAGFVAQQVIDAAVQLFGGLGVVSDHPVERLYREIRALRIYEGATEVQQLIIARDLLKEVGYPQ